MNTAGDVGIQFVQGIEQGVVGVVGLTDGVSQGTFREECRALGWGMVGRKSLLDGGRDETVVDK